MQTFLFKEERKIMNILQYLIPNFIETKVQIFDWMSPFSNYNNNNKPEGESERLR
jgi:hypothetical protein